VMAVASVAGLSTLKSTGSASSGSGIDPRLIHHPHTTRLRGSLSDGSMVTGFLSPTIPGANTVHLVVHGTGRAPKTASVLTLVATHLDMKMRPVRSVLVLDSQGYAGVIHIPMFGRYRLSITAVASGITRRGSITLDFPLPRF
jgi:hypothetical protein